MKIYTKPEIEITVLNNEDVIAVSGGIVITNFTKSDKGYNEINNF